MLKWTTAGESHGQALLAVIEGLPSGVTITTSLIEEALARRRQGYGRGARQKFEKDHVTILSGIRHGKTTGAPIAIEIFNSEWAKWETVMSPDPVPAEALYIDAGKGDVREMARNRPLTSPRPGHADLAGMISYRLDDARNVLERASARETAARVALGACAQAYLDAISEIAIVSHVISVGPLTIEGSLPLPTEAAVLDESPMRTTNPDAEKKFCEQIDSAAEQGETIGGVAEVVAWNVPIGLGTHVNAEDRLDVQLAAALMSIQSVKAVEIGDGFAQAASLGSAAHDEIIGISHGKVLRASNRAGGIEGGTSNGEPVVARAAFKPISTVPNALRSIDLATGEGKKAFHQRSDTCQVVPGAVIAEAMTALVIAKALCERVGGRSIEEAKAHLDWYCEYVSSRLLSGGETRVDN